MRDERKSERAQVGVAFAGMSMAVAGGGSTIGGLAIGEPLFLDEPADYSGARPAAAGASPFELFANEDEPPLWATFPTQTAAGVTPGPAVAARTKRPGALSPTRPSLLLVFLVIAGIALVAALTAYQGSGLPVELWSLLRR